MKSMRTPLAPVERMLALLRIGATATWSARTVLVGRALFYLVVVTLLAAFWNIVALERLPGTLASLLPEGGLAVYVGITEWIVLSVPSIHLRLEDDIRSGAVEAHLLRPVSYPLLRIVETGGGMLVRFAVLGVAGMIGYMLSGHPAVSPIVWLCVGILGVLGGVVGILLYALVGMCAFWLRRTTPIYLCVQKSSFLLGGLLAPLTLYPHWLRQIAQASPFAAQLYWPAAGVIAPANATVWHALTMQVLWIALLAALVGLLWRAGLRRLLRQGS
jgi:ABC-2 type transport system permease protein